MGAVSATGPVLPAAWTIRTGEIGAALVYVLLALAPPFLMNTLGASSYAAGMLLGSAAAMPFLVRRLPALRVDSSLVLAFCLLGAWAFAPLVADRSVPLSRVLLSAASLTWLGFVALLVRDGFAALDDRSVRRLLAGLAVALLASAWLAALLDYRPLGYGGDLARPVFPFREPSHFALVAGPLLGAAAAVCGAKWRLAIVINVGLLGLLFPSFSLALFAVVMAVLCFRLPTLLVLAGGGAVTLLALVTLDLGYFSARVALGAEATNMSSLMWLQGLEDALESFRRSNGLGAGFQALGYGPPGPIAQRITELFDFRMSREAGGFIAAKLIGELGMAGILLVLLILRTMIRSARSVRRAVLGPRPIDGSDLKSVVAHSYVALFGVELFVRSIGYFSPSLLLFVAALLYLRQVDRWRRQAVRPGGQYGSLRPAAVAR